MGDRTSDVVHQCRENGEDSVITDMSGTVKLRLRIPRGDVAAFLVEQVVKDNYVGQMPIIFT